MILSPKELSAYLRHVQIGASRLDKLKIVYRPYLCPFGLLIHACNNSKTILDIGCGSGQFLLLLSEYTKVTKLGGIEISPNLVKNARALLSNQSKTQFQIEIYDGIHIPDFVSEFDTVTLIDVFHHIKRGLQERFILELYGKMKAGSNLIFKDINASHPYVFINKIHDFILGEGGGNEISVSNAKQRLVKAGFTILSVSKNIMIWYPHYTIICVK